jgi:hypothetical protein
MNGLGRARRSLASNPSRNASAIDDPSLGKQHCRKTGVAVRIVRATRHLPSNIDGESADIQETPRMSQQSLVRDLAAAAYCCVERKGLLSLP